MRLSIQAAVVRRKHDHSTIMSMKESCPRQRTASISKRSLQLLFHLVFEHQRIRQRSHPQRHGSSMLLLKERASAANLAYRRRQKWIPNLYGLQRVLPLPNSRCALHFNHNCVRHINTLLKEPEKLFKRIKITKPGYILGFSMLKI